jgi:hypothetical protein
MCAGAELDSLRVMPKGKNHDASHYGIATNSNKMS